ncbi:hypothetical protein ABEX05_00180 [Bacillus velezensis]
MEWLVNILQLSAVGVITAWLINWNSNKVRQRDQAKIYEKIEKIKIYENQSATKKSEQLEEFWNMFLDCFDTNNLTEEELLKFNKDFNKRMMKLIINLVGSASDSTILKFKEYKTFDFDGQNKEKQIEAILLLAELIIEYRKDLGHKDTKITPNDILPLYITDWTTFSTN